MSRDESVSIIIVNYHCEEEVRACIESIVTHTANLEKVEVIVVSNSPLDEEKRQTMRVHPMVSLVELDTNNGFAAGCNAGAKRAKGKYLFFLNPDTQFCNDVLAHLTKQYQELASAGIIAPLTVDSDGRPLATTKNDISALVLLHEALPFLGWVLPKSHQSGHHVVTGENRVDVVQGSALFISRTLFKELDGMDERFFMYWEENDLCLRARKLGYRNYVAESAKIAHKGAVTTSKNFYHLFLIKHRSRKLFLQKHHPNLVRLNRILAILAYSWRTIGSIVLMNHHKKRQFYAVLRWYLTSYKSEDIQIEELRRFT